MVYYKQLRIIRQLVTLLIFFFLSLMNTKAETLPESFIKTETTTSSNVMNSREHVHNIHKVNNETSGLGNDHVLINNILEGHPDVADNVEKNIKTFSYGHNNLLIVKPVIGLTNYSGENFKRIKNMYLRYKQNLTLSIKDKQLEEKRQDREGVHRSDNKLTTMKAENELDDFEFESWNNRRIEDGFLCQNDNECQWLDWKLRCKLDVELNFNASVSSN